MPEKSGHQRFRTAIFSVTHEIINSHPFDSVMITTKEASLAGYHCRKNRFLAQWLAFFIQGVRVS
jgi:hypothetical protein